MPRSIPRCCGNKTPAASETESVKFVAVFPNGSSALIVTGMLVFVCEGDGIALTRGSPTFATELMGYGPYLMLLTIRGWALSNAGEPRADETRKDAPPTRMSASFNASMATL